MRAVVQRVTRAEVSVQGRQIASIGQGLMVLIGIGREDTHQDAVYLASRLSRLRIFSDGSQETALSLSDIQGELLLVSQFTLYGDTRKGRRPSFSDSMPGVEARILFDELCELCRREQLSVQCGAFGEMMQVQLINDGPYTILIDSKKNF